MLGACAPGRAENEEESLFSSCTCGHGGWAGSCEFCSAATMGLRRRQTWRAVQRALTQPRAVHTRGLQQACQGAAASKRLTVMPMPRMSANGTRAARSSSQHSRPMSSALSVNRASVTGEWWDGSGMESGWGQCDKMAFALQMQKNGKLTKPKSQAADQLPSHQAASPERDRLSQSPCPMNLSGSAAPCDKVGWIAGLPQEIPRERGESVHLHNRQRWYCGSFS